MIAPRSRWAIGDIRAGSKPCSADAAAGDPARSRGNDGLYALVERRLIREGGDDAQGLAGWLRLGFADERLNAVGHYLGGGLSYTGPFRGRDDDQVGIAVGVAELGAPFRLGSALGGDPLEAREVIAEVTYRAPLNRWLTLQPDIQYVFNPGGDLHCGTRWWWDCAPNSPSKAGVGSSRRAFEINI
jgi:porin